MRNKNIISCPQYQKCNAPLCPEINNPDGIWYPDEPICRSHKFSALNWIRKQRKIAKKAIYRDFYFTKADLEAIIRVTIKTKGQNPDSDKGSDTFKIPLKHPLKPHLSGYPKTQLAQDNPKLLNPIVSDIEQS